MMPRFLKKKLLFFFCAIIFSSYGYCNTKNHLYQHKGDTVKITIPNVFTPNGDGKNDSWSMIVTDGLEIFDLTTKIYNRWGKQVFESTNINQNWNGHNVYEGSLCSSGIYFYVISYTDGNTNETKTLKGFIELIK